MRLTAELTGDEIVFQVGDEGPGFPEDFLPRAFERFSRADEARPRPGSGLGLAIAQTIASAHGGEACVSTEPGVADVWIALPLGGGQQPHGRSRRVGATRR